MSNSSICPICPSVQPVPALHLSSPSFLSVSQSVRCLLSVQTVHLSNMPRTYTVHLPVHPIQLSVHYEPTVCNINSMSYVYLYWCIIRQIQTLLRLPVLTHATFYTELFVYLLLQNKFYLMFSFTEKVNILHTHIFIYHKFHKCFDCESKR